MSRGKLIAAGSAAGVGFLAGFFSAQALKPSTRATPMVRSGIPAITAYVPPEAYLGKPAPAVPVAWLGAEQYVTATAPTQMPVDVRQALAKLFGHGALEIAGSDESYNDTCLASETMPSRRLLVAAVGPRFAVVHYEVGGFSPSQEVVVFRRGARGASELWSDSTRQRIANPQVFVSQLKDHTFFQHVALE